MGSLLIPPLLGLGVWQLQRADEKRQLLDVLAAKPLLEALPETLPPHPAWVALSGRFGDQFYLLDNRTRGGVVGYEVLAPLRRQAGSSAVLVNLGWLAAPSRRSELPQLTLPQTPVTLQGWLLPFPSGVQLTTPVWSDSVRWPLRIQQPDRAAMARQLDLSLYGGVVQLETPLLDAVIPNWQPVNMPPERHLGYAVQWFSLALMTLCWLLWWGSRGAGR